MFDLFVLGFSPSLQLTCEVMRSYPTLGRAKHQKAVATAAKNRIFGLDMHLCDSIRHQFIQDYQYLLDEWRKLIHITYLNSTKLGKRWKCEKKSPTVFTGAELWLTRTERWIKCWCYEWYQLRYLLRLPQICEPKDIGFARKHNVMSSQEYRSNDISCFVSPRKILVPQAWWVAAKSKSIQIRWIKSYTAHISIHYTKRLAGGY